MLQMGRCPVPVGKWSSHFYPSRAPPTCSAVLLFARIQCTDGPSWTARSARVLPGLTMARSIECRPERHISSSFRPPLRHQRALRPFRTREGPPEARGQHATAAPFATLAVTARSAYAARPGPLKRPPTQDVPTPRHRRRRNLWPPRVLRGRCALYEVPILPTCHTPIPLYITETSYVFFFSHSRPFAPCATLAISPRYPFFYFCEIHRTFRHDGDTGAEAWGGGWVEDVEDRRAGWCLLTLL